MWFSYIFKLATKRQPNTILKAISQMSHAAVKCSLKKWERWQRQGFAGLSTHISSQKLLAGLKGQNYLGRSGHTEEAGQGSHYFKFL